MFENIIGHKDLLADLKKELSNQTFPPAVLFYGLQYSGKLSTALETARILSCELQGVWNCSCPACFRQRLLLDPYTIICGPRQLLAEIRAAQEVLKHCQNRTAAFLYIRAIRKLTRRFDPHIFPAEDTRKKEIENLLLRLEELIQEAEGTQKLFDDKKLGKYFQEVEESAKRLQGFLPQENIPIAQIRNLSLWAFHSAPAVKKVIIIENASRMQEASRNALLKILEEPPPSTHFILLAERREELIPTIRSRLRAYRFKPRTKEENREVLKRIFKEDKIEYESLKEYFCAWEDIQLTRLHSQALLFLEKLLEPKPCLIREQIPELFSKDITKAYCKYFLEEVLNILAKGLNGKAEAEIFNSIPLERIEKMNKFIRERYREFLALNLSIPLFLESLFLKLKGNPL